MRALFVAFALALALLAPAGAQTRPGDFAPPAGPAIRDLEERVLDWSVDVWVEKDGSLLVAETIEINAQNRIFNLGWVRTFQTAFRDRRGTRQTVDYEVVSLTRNGEPEPYEIQTVRDGIEILVGPESYPVLPKGRHTYVLTYRTTDQLGFYAEGDELYWNVTPLDFGVRIDKASIRIRLPEGARPLGMEAAAGRIGGSTAAGAGATIAETEPGVVESKAARFLSPGEGYTILVWWPKGIVAEPTAAQRWWKWLLDNLAIGFGLGGLLGSLGFLGYAWNRVGRDPPRGTIIPLFSAPKDFEPAEARFLRELGFDNKAFAATIVSLATKRAVTIHEESGWLSRGFTLKRGEGNEAQLGPLERQVLNALLGGRDEIELKQTNWRTIKAAADGLSAALARKHEPKNFVSNTGWVVGGAAFLGVGAVLVFLMAEGNETAFISGLVLLGAGALALIPISQLMKAPSAAGQKLRDEIDGYRMFLDTAEKERWEILNPPEMTPELFEKNLPYALALEVDQSWSETFEREIRIREGADYHYRPSWYVGRDFSGIGANGLVGSLSNALSGAISSSAQAPGSKGGVGGGSIGGGGGGGGFRGR